MPLLFLTESDQAVLRELLTAWRAGRLNLPSRGEAVPAEELQTPETYIAKPQEAGGIPALTPTEGTGDDDYDEPGVATCDIYQIVMSGATPELRPVTGFEKEVHNLSTDIVLQEWIPVGRTKYGRWIVLPWQLGARMIHGTLTDDLVGAGGTFEIDNVVAIFGANPTDGTGDTVEVQNSHSFEGDSGGRAVAVWCQEDEQWEALQVTCAAEEE